MQIEAVSGGSYSIYYGNTASPINIVIIEACYNAKTDTFYDVCTSSLSTMIEVGIYSEELLVVEPSLGAQYCDTIICPLSRCFSSTLSHCDT